MKTNFLLADDDADDTSIFCEALGLIDTDVECSTVENGRRVFERLKEFGPVKPDLIFLDINMPIMDGWDCLRALKQNPEYKTIPAIMYSTSSARKDVELAYQLGALLFLTKPEDFKELCQILEIVAKNPHEILPARLRDFGSVKLNSN